MDALADGRLLASLKARFAAGVVSGDERRHRSDVGTNDHR